MPDLDEFVVPARRTLGPIKEARASMAAGELWRATIASSRYGVYTITGHVRAVGSDLHIGGFNLGSPTSVPSDLHGLTRIDDPDDDVQAETAPADTAPADTAPTDAAPPAHGDIVRVHLAYNPEETIAVAGLALERSGYGHLIVGGWHVVHPAVRSVSVLAHAGEHGLSVPSHLPALKTE